MLNTLFVKRGFRHIELVYLCCLFLAAFTLYLSTMPRLITFEDAGLFLQVCATGGIAHPPGYPLFSLFCVPVFSLSAIDPVLIGNAISGFFASLTVCMMFVILRQLDENRYLASLGALLLMVAKDFWAQSIIIEVYSLNTLIVLGCLSTALHYRKNGQRYGLYMLTFILALGLSNHWPLVVLTVPGILIFVENQKLAIYRLLKSPIFMALSFLLVIIGLSPYLWLFRQNVDFSYSGSLTNLTDFIKYFSRESFSAVDQQSVTDINDKISYLIWINLRLSTQLSLLFMPFTILGLCFAYRLWSRPVHLGMITILICHSFLLCLLLGFDFDFLYQAVMATYLLVAIICTILFTIAGIRLFGYWLSKQLSKYIIDQKTKQVILRIFTIAPYIILLHSAVTNWHVNYRAGDTLAQDYAAVILSQVEKNSSLIISSDVQTFPLGYLHNIAGYRPDITLLHSQNLFFKDKIPGYDDQSFRHSVNKMAEQNTIYAINVPWLPTGKNHGLVTKYGVTPRGVPDANKEFLNHGIQYDNMNQSFIKKVLNAYVGKEILQAQDLYFTHQLLYQYSLYLLEKAADQRLHTAEISLLIELQKTFPGTFATLATRLANPKFNPPTSVLLQMSAVYIDNTPIESDNYQEALFYYYLFLLEPDALLRQKYLTTSKKLFPEASNPAFNIKTR